MNKRGQIIINCMGPIAIVMCAGTPTALALGPGEVACEGSQGNAGQTYVAQCFDDNSKSLGEAGVTDDLQEFYYIAWPFECTDSSPECDISPGGEDVFRYVPGMGRMSFPIEFPPGETPNVTIRCFCQPTY